MFSFIFLEVAKPYAGAELQIIPSYVETGSGLPMDSEVELVVISC